jgi:hypothetical protein
MPLTRQARNRIAQALGPDAADGVETGHTLLCRREAGAFQRAAKSGENSSPATRKAAVPELAAETEGVRVCRSGRSLRRHPRTAAELAARERRTPSY